MDMARTMTNVIGNCLATAVVARWEGQLADAACRRARKGGSGDHLTPYANGGHREFTSPDGITRRLETIQLERPARVSLIHRTTPMDGHTLRQLFVLANDFKDGDLAVGGTTDDRIRGEARRQLLATTVGDIRHTSIVDDHVTAALDRSRDRQHDASLDGLSIADVKRTLVSDQGAPPGPRRTRMRSPAK